MSMRMPPEGGASIADHHAPRAPAPTQVADNYSSNYKGVMLCDRPGIQVDRTAPQGGHAEPFLSAVNAPEQLGLNPIRKQHLGAADGKKAKPKSSALTNHKRWLRSLKQLKQELADEEEMQREQEADKRQQLAEESQKVRDQIRNIKAAMTGIDDIQGPASARALISKEDMLSELKSKLNRDIVTELHDTVAETAPSPKPASAKAPSAKAASAKPAWARTEEEEEENEEMEVEDLLAFAEDLDIDQYMDDCEFREALSAAKARIQELDSEDEEDDAKTQCTERTQGSVGSVYSTMSAALRAKEAKEAAGDKDWDGSVAPSEKSRVSRLSRAVAEELLEMNPNLRKKHSARSLAEVVEKKGFVPAQTGDQGTRGAFDPEDHEKFGRCGMGAVKVAVHNEENRLHRHGEITDGKDLPYLYRNPAV